jgi:hypothetical protein
MSEILFSRDLIARIANAMRHGFLPPIEFQALANDIKGDQRIAALRASVAGRPGDDLVKAIEVKCRSLALRYNEWLDQVGT